MSQFVLFVNGAPYGSQHAYSALRFAEAALDAGHQVRQVFFYQDGVYNASRLLCPASDEFDLAARWDALHQRDVALVSCVSAGLRRGVIDVEAAEDADLDAANLSASFILGGLGEYVTAAANADRTVQFG
ncbi:sulfur relay protein TusD/DsrE [Ferrimonas balearica DSM 9799]|uniref:Sulfur relay protein TusD/DsrE n=1 Tax=Ferrimonas balearica (strain DSM 9799 / CCM 4581 / KCTC 23876 / PAT) TaxID=550540 RepID=E1SSK1_FERBD|nr:sulfurtransferase complex subunit TusD [Ferrimonas balearica]ADN76030.1 sulfur relay protein TusD/DsrE [Ferrimonas balearica DSM 9799]MBW3138939.1 sulfurtransferase complex subunit TusD [Ferrimonas balearica]MBW3163469.1 sulfurtransferase complex subunit TusD [Ferrimonas balearica]MBY5979722.1 sulfurtransferase complex subunit TusD [Ferrimonas balearica]MBY6095214.1 sulfurtransferase complex subunit TusD [Ferrimonas balearica]